MRSAASQSDWPEAAWSQGSLPNQTGRPPLLRETRCPYCMSMTRLVAEEVDGESVVPQRRRPIRAFGRRIVRPSSTPPEGSSVGISTNMDDIGGGWASPSIRSTDFHRKRVRRDRLVDDQRSGDLVTRCRRSAGDVATYLEDMPPAAARCGVTPRISSFDALIASGALSGTAKWLYYGTARRWDLSQVFQASGGRGIQFATRWSPLALQLAVRSDALNVAMLLVTRHPNPAELRRQAVEGVLCSRLCTASAETLVRPAAGRGSAHWGPTCRCLPRFAGRRRQIEGCPGRGIARRGRATYMRSSQDGTGHRGGDCSAMTSWPRHADQPVIAHAATRLSSYDRGPPGCRLPPRLRQRGPPLQMLVNTKFDAPYRDVPAYLNSRVLSGTDARRSVGYVRTA